METGTGDANEPMATRKYLIQIMQWLSSDSGWS
jgi:hypothetical protein